MGRLTPEAAEQALADGDADVIAMGRPLIADPDLPRKLAAGQRHRIRPCTYQYRCIGAIFLNQPVQCAVNPEAGHEAEPAPPAADPPRRVLVAGGGPAGLECARRLAERGHHVELWEASDRLGGRLALAEQADADLGGLLAWLIGGAEDAGVVLRTGTPVTERRRRRRARVGDRRPLAGRTAASASTTCARGSLDGEPLDGPVVVHGSGKAAVSLALHARTQGHEVTLVPDGAVLAPELGLPGRFRLVAAAEAAGVRCRRATPPTPATVVHIGRGPGAEPPSHREVHVIGDAAGTGGLADALAAAARAAAAI